MPSYLVAKHFYQVPHNEVTVPERLPEVKQPRLYQNIGFHYHVEHDSRDGTEDEGDVTDRDAYQSEEVDGGEDVGRQEEDDTHDVIYVEDDEPMELDEPLHAQGDLPEHEVPGAGEPQPQEEEEQEEDAGDYLGYSSDDSNESDTEIDTNFPFIEHADYESILKELSTKWIVAEADHNVSKVASNVMWKLAFQFIPNLIRAKDQQEDQTKIPQFQQIRRNYTEDNCPEVELQFGYRNKETDETFHIKSTVTPKSRFPPNKYEKLYEMATVKVS